MCWKRQPQERTGNYLFSGSFLITAAVYETLLRDEVLEIYDDLRAFANNQNGIDYLQIYTNENGKRLFFIDQLSKEMIESNEFTNEDNHCTLMYSHEY